MSTDLPPTAKSNSRETHNIESLSASNSNRLREIAERSGVDSYLIDSMENLEESWLEGKKNIGVTSGASAPEDLVNNFISNLKKKFTLKIEEVEIIKENVIFKIPGKLN